MSPGDRFSKIGCDPNIQIVIYDVSGKLSRLLTVLICLFGIGGITALGLSVRNRYRQTQQSSAIERANRLFEQQQYSLAAAAYDRLLETDPERSLTLWTNRGYALIALNQYEEALASCTEATALTQKAALAWNCRGEALYRLGRLNDALRAFETAIAANPNRAVFWLNRSQVLLDVEQFAAAAEASRKAIALLQSQPKTPDTARGLALAWQRQGYSLLELGQNRQALQAFALALKERTNNLPALQGKGIALYRLGENQKAIATFRQILAEDLTPEREAINQLYLAASLCQTSQAHLANRAWQRVMELSENRALQTMAESGCGIR